MDKIGGGKWRGGGARVSNYRPSPRHAKPSGVYTPPTGKYSNNIAAPSGNAVWILGVRSEFLPFFAFQREPVVEEVGASGELEQTISLGKEELSENLENCGFSYYNQ